MNYPRLSVVTPSFNQGKFIDETIRSVIGQNYPSLEYIVVDGGSADQTLDIIRKHETSLAWWSTEPDRGQSHALNKGLNRSTGEIMGYLNADDLYCSWAFRTIATIFSQLPEIEWLTTLRPIIWNADSIPVQALPLKGFTRPAFFTGQTLGKSKNHIGWIQQESTFWKRSLWEKAGGHISEDRHYAMDFDLWARFYEHAELVGIPVPIGGFRLHGEQKSAAHLDLYYAEADQVLARYGQMQNNVQTKLWNVIYDFTTARWVLIKKVQ